jgi:hypothetical protein
VTTNDRLLHIYLRDHYAVATGSVALAQRIAGNHAERWPDADLPGLAADLAAARGLLEQVMNAVGARPDPVKTGAAVVGERLGRLKLNGSLLRRSPLSSVVEFEAMRVALEANASLWRTLRQVGKQDERIAGVALTEVLDRSAERIELVERLRVRAAGEALTSG